MKVILLFAMLLLNGCSLYRDYMRSSDINEYLLVTEIKSLAEKNKDCVSPNNDIQSLYLTGLNLKNYTLHIPYHEEEIDMSKNLFEIINGLYLHQSSMSTTYCKIKMNSIIRNAEIIQTVIGDSLK